MVRLLGSRAAVFPTFGLSISEKSLFLPHPRRAGRAWQFAWRKALLPGFHEHFVWQPGMLKEFQLVSPI